MGWIVEDAVKELKSWGQPGGAGNELVLKSDGEPALVALRSAVASYLGGVVTPEGPPVGEKQSNGTAEEAGKAVREIMRVYKCAIEDGIGEALPEDSPILLWMARWAAMAHNRSQVGHDGKTAYQRQLGRPCRHDVVPFGERVLYRQLS